MALAPSRAALTRSICTSRPSSRRCLSSRPSTELREPRRRPRVRCDRSARRRRARRRSRGLRSRAPAAARSSSAPGALRAGHVRQIERHDAEPAGAKHEIECADGSPHRRRAQARRCRGHRSRRSANPQHAGEVEPAIAAASGSNASHASTIATSSPRAPAAASVATSRLVRPDDRRPTISEISPRRQPPPSTSSSGVPVAAIAAAPVPAPPAAACGRDGDARSSDSSCWNAGDFIVFAFYSPTDVSISTERAMAIKWRKRPDSRCYRFFWRSPASCPPHLLPKDDSASRRRAPAGFARVAGALTHRNFRLVWMAALGSTIGTWMQNYAQSWLVFDLTKSNFYKGVDDFLAQLPILLFMLIGGVIADRARSAQAADAVAVRAGVLGVHARRAALHGPRARSGTSSRSRSSPGCGQAFGGPAYQSMIPVARPAARSAERDRAQLHAVQSVARARPACAGSLVLAADRHGGVFRAERPLLLHRRGGADDAAAAAARPSTTRARHRRRISRAACRYVRDDPVMLTLTILVFVSTFLVDADPHAAAGVRAPTCSRRGRRHAARAGCRCSWPRRVWAPSSARSSSAASAGSATWARVLFGVQIDTRPAHRALRVVATSTG